MKDLSWREWAVIALSILLLIFLSSRNSNSSEINKILSLDNTAKQSEELLKLLERVGPVETQEKLVRSGLPFTGETHLLVHTVGNYIYNTRGLEGLPLCKDYFLSACYHAFIINTLADHGLTGMAEVMGQCEVGPPGVASQCAHGAGHGFVAWHDYDLLRAAEMCDKLGEKVDEFHHFNCYDGVFMENVWGVHDGAPSEKRWLSEEDIYYPCTDPRIPEKYLGGCWANQATLIYQHYKGDLRKTALACDAVSNKDYQAMCYNNFARQIHPITAGGVKKVFDLCSNATGERWRNECVMVNMGSYWSVGDRETSYKICDALSEPLKDECFRNLAGMVRYHYGSKPKEREFYCSKISSKIQKQECLE